MDPDFANLGAGRKSLSYAVRLGNEVRRLELLSAGVSLLHELTNLKIDDIMTAILPEAEQDELPTGFSVVGHVGVCF